jgi:hypothetical protein
LKLKKTDSRNKCIKSQNMIDVADDEILLDKNMTV